MNLWSDCSGRFVSAKFLETVYCSWYSITQMLKKIFLTRSSGFKILVTSVCILGLFARIYLEHIFVRVLQSTGIPEKFLDTLCTIHNPKKPTYILSFVAIFRKIFEDDELFRAPWPPGLSEKIFLIVSRMIRVYEFLAHF